MFFVRPAMRDHLSWETTFAGQKGWSPKTGSTVLLYMARPCDKWRGDEKGRHGATQRHCYNKEKENGLPHPPTADNKDPHIQQGTGCYMTADESGGSQRRHGKVLSKKTWKRWVSAGMEPAGSPVTVRDWDFSSPDAPRGTGKSKSFQSFRRHCNGSRKMHWQANQNNGYYFGFTLFVFWFHTFTMSSFFRGRPNSSCRARFFTIASNSTDWNTATALTETQQQHWLKHSNSTDWNTATALTETQQLHWLKHSNCTDWNTATALTETQQQHWLKHSNCTDWNTATALTETQQQHWLKHSNCTDWNTAIALTETQQLHWLKHSNSTDWNTAIALTETQQLHWLKHSNSTDMHTTIHIHA